MEEEDEVIDLDPHQKENVTNASFHMLDWETPY